MSINFLYHIAQASPENSVKTTDISNVKLPTTWQELIGMGMLLLLSPMVLQTIFQAWGNKEAIKDAKRKELEKKIEEKNQECYKNEIQNEILKVRLENAEAKVKELYQKNMELEDHLETITDKSLTSFNNQVKILEEKIRILEDENIQLKKG